MRKQTRQERANALQEELKRIRYDVKFVADEIDEVRQQYSNLPSKCYWKIATALGEIGEALRDAEELVR